MMGARPWLILTAVALARIGFGYQYQTVATLGPDLMRVFRLHTGFALHEYLNQLRLRTAFERIRDDAQVLSYP
jgi:hypothetical protein